MEDLSSFSRYEFVKNIILFLSAVDGHKLYMAAVYGHKLAINSTFALV